MKRLCEGKYSVECQVATYGARYVIGDSDTWRVRLKSDALVCD